MLGAIIGDIAGSVYEFNNVKTEDFPLFSKMSSFTDDTICTVAVADCAMNDWNYKDALVDWCSRYPRPMGGYGTSFQQWLKSADHVPYYSWGNGSAMRVSSIGWLFDNDIQTSMEAKKSAVVTHDHPKGVAGAQITALTIFYLRNGRTKEQTRAFAEKIYGHKLPEYVPFSNLFDETSEGTVPVALSCFLASESFEDAVRKAILIGGDSDTIAAITGSFAEAYYGIPDEIAKLAMRRLPEDMKEVVHQFYRTIGKEE